MNRIAYFDNVKFILILLVVIGHFAEEIMDTSELAFSLRTFIYTFHMPAFIFISGLFYNPKREKVIKNTVYYFTIFLLMQSLAIVRVIFVEGNTVNNVFCVKGVSWYLLALCIWSLLTFLIPENVISRKYITIISILLGLIIGFDNSLNTDMFCISRVIVFYPFFLMGTVIDKDWLVKFTNHKAVKGCGVFIIVAVAVASIYCKDNISFITPLLSARNQYYTTGMYEQGACLRGCVYVVEFAMTFSVLALIPKRKMFFSSLGARTISVYALHYSFIRVTLAFFPDRLAVALPAAIIIVLVLSSRYVYSVFDCIQKWCVSKVE